MGRTLRTSTQLVHEFEEQWKNFYRALRKEDQEALAELWASAHYHAAPISHAAADDPFEAMLLAMLVGMMGRIQHLERVLEARNTVVDAEEWSQLCDT